MVNALAMFGFGFIVGMMLLNPLVVDAQEELVALKAHYAKMECIEVVDYQPTGVKR